MGGVCDLLVVAVNGAGRRLHRKEAAQCRNVDPFQGRHDPLLVRHGGRTTLTARDSSRRGPLTGPNPTDRGKLGSRIHLITDRNGLPLSLGISAANMHDSQGLQPLVRGIPPVRSPHGPRRRRLAKLHADKGYGYDHLALICHRRLVRVDGHNQSV